MADPVALADGITVLERGWLSANNILLRDPHQAVLVDSGYCTHSAQTLALVQGVLGDQPLDVLLNTHLHSDHCGGNAALQRRYPRLRTLIPPGQERHVRHWDPVALSYEPTGQQCPPFMITGVLEPGNEMQLGGRAWQVHAAPGHDQHSVVLFEPQECILISADALWENGFGVVFQELEGEKAFEEVGATLDLIERLAPAVVIPGHGPVFTSVGQALSNARRRLDGFAQDPMRHAMHGIKVLLKFKLLELQRQAEPEFLRWAHATPYVQLVHSRWFGATSLNTWIRQVLDDLVRSGAARREGSFIVNA